MTHVSRLGALALSAAILTPGIGLADVTASEVWQNWQRVGGDYGQSFANEGESMAGDTLTVSGITITMDMPELAIMADVGDVGFRELGDGTVAIEIPDNYPMRFTINGEGGENVDLTLNVSQPEMSMIASGSASDMSYVYSAPRAEMSVTELVVDGEPIEATISLSMQALAGVYASKSLGGLLSSDVTIGALALLADIPDPEGGETDIFGMSMSMENIRSEASGSIPIFGGTENLSAMLERGLSQSSLLSYGPVQFSVSGNDGFETFGLDGSIAEGSIDTTIGGTGMTYTGTSNDVRVSVSGSSIPFPAVGFAIAESNGSLSVPLVPTEDAQDFSLVSSITGFAIDDIIWSMFDPGGQLPHDPADISFDLSGKGNWLIDITNPEAMAELEMAPVMPGAVETIALNALRLSALGTELTGSGAFAFGDMSGGAPVMPTGTADFKLTGANGLIDTLVGMGLVPEDQAMGARMMLGLFARPGEGADTLESTIEIKEDGSVLANGQRIR